MRKIKNIRSLSYLSFVFLFLLSACGQTQAIDEAVRSELTTTQTEQLPETSETSEIKEKLVANEEPVKETVETKEAISSEISPILPFTGERQLILGDLDDLGRATFAHIQLQDRHEPTDRREPRLNFDPVGWHNYKMPYGDGTKEAWLMNRGHLVGYQFSGLNDEPRNLVPETAWFNTGNFVGMDSGNQAAMLFYENELDNWLANHPNFWLDYRVTPIFVGEELIPRQVELQYVGLDENGERIQIRLGSPREEVDVHLITRVLLDNVSENAQINYLTGTATPIVGRSTQELPYTPTSSANMQTSSDGERTVYVASGGKSDVFWYSMENMPSNTNRANVVQMTEQQAIDLGKRHSGREE